MDFENNDISWALSRSVVRGELDNTLRDRITGRIWLEGREEPLDVDLRGNCMRDVAGCRFEFVNPDPDAGDDVDLASLQTGVAGEITASRKIRYASEPDSDAAADRVGNCLFLEWFSDVNGRVVLEGPDFSVNILGSSWVMTSDDEIRQIQRVSATLERWEREVEEEYDDDYDYDPPQMSEFEWERALRESDALTERFSKVLEKYIDHPDCDRLIAREMGWTWLFDDSEVPDEDMCVNDMAVHGSMDEMEDDFDMQPNPITEGVDWVKGRNGRITHPLTDMAFSLAMDLCSYCKKQGSLLTESDQDVKDMIFQIQALTAKLAGALDGLAYDFDLDGGLIVACLKRSFPYINSALARLDNAGRKMVVDELMFIHFKNRMLDIRGEIIKLMSRYRKHAC